MKQAELSKKNLKVAIVCDWLVGIGGAERVVLQVHRMFPDAPIYTSQYDPNAIDWFSDADVRTGWLQKVPKQLKKFLPLLRQRYFSRLDLTSYDLVISINFGAESKAVRFSDSAVHICYCNAPTHYYWSRFDEYVANPGFPTGFNWLARLCLRLLIKPLRRWDFKAGQKPTVILGNSTHISQQIAKYYNRKAETVFPPVELERFTAKEQKRSGYVAVGRQTPYKRIDLAVQACSELDLPLTVIGNGPQNERLRTMAGLTVTFVTDADDTVLADYFSKSVGLIFAGLDDFGIVVVEALASGCPVVAYGAGGALDTVIPGKTGLLFNEQTVESLKSALQEFENTEFKTSDLTTHAQTFSSQAFSTRMQKIIEKSLQQPEK